MQCICQMCMSRHVYCTLETNDAAVQARHILCGMHQHNTSSSSSLPPSLLARAARRSGVAVIAAGAGAAAWFFLRSTPLGDRPSQDQDALLESERGDRSYQGVAQERLRKPDIRLPASIYGWAAGVQTKVSGSLETVEDDAPSTSGRKNAAQIAAEHQNEVAVMRDLMKQKGLGSLPDRLQHSDPELIRLTALQRAVASIQASANWLGQHQFLSRQDMHPYKNLVWWEDLDSEGRPVLMIRLGRAVNECTTKAEADTIAEVIISQIDYGITNFLSDVQGSADKLVVVLDCRETTAFKASKAVRLMKNVAVTLNQHYPSRLHQLFFVEPPAVMKWPIQAAKPLLHADTGNKISVCSLSDPAIPIDLSKIPDVW